MKNNPQINYLLTHGAGAPSSSEWMNNLVKEIDTQSNGMINVIRFNFSYMNKRVSENKKYPPDRMPKLVNEWEEQIVKLNKSKPIFIGGKSMGGRAATLLDFEQLPIKINGIINFGFPFHAPGKLPGVRISHLKNLNIPCLINQGERDPMGTKDEIKKYHLSSKIKINFLDDGNHDLKPRVKSGIQMEDNIKSSVREMINFINENINIKI